MTGSLSPLCKYQDKCVSSSVAGLERKRITYLLARFARSSRLGPFAFDIGRVDAPEEETPGDDDWRSPATILDSRVNAQSMRAMDDLGNDDVELARV